MADAKMCDFCEEFFVPKSGADITKIIFANKDGVHLGKDVKDICPVCLMKLKKTLTKSEDSH